MTRHIIISSIIYYRPFPYHSISKMCIRDRHSALVFLTAETSLWLVAFVFAVRSIGIGMLMMTTVNWGMSAVAAQYTSDGTALISSLRTVGGAMGTAVFVAVMSAAGGPQGEALLHLSLIHI